MTKLSFNIVLQLEMHCEIQIRLKRIFTQELINTRTDGTKPDTNPKPLQIAACTCHGPSPMDCTYTCSRMEPPVSGNSFKGVGGGWLGHLGSPMTQRKG